MAIIQPVYFHLLPTLILAALSLKQVNSISHGHNHQQLKSLNFTLYVHDTLNKTGYITAPGVAAGVSSVTSTTAPFGTLYAFHDPITVSASNSSAAAGFSEGIMVTSSFDGLWNVAMMKFSLQLKDHAGTIVTVGGLHTVKPSDIPVLEGTGDFKFVKGYVTISLVDAKGFSLVFKNDFHLYWPPCAS